MKDQTRNLADLAAPHIEANGAQLQWTQAGYDATLPSQVTAEQAKILNGHNKALIPALTVAFGERAVTVLAENPTFPQVEGVAQIGASKVSVVVERLGQRSTGIPKEGQVAEKIPTPGLTHVKVITSSGSEVKKAREFVAALGADKL